MIPAPRRPLGLRFALLLGLAGCASSPPPSPVEVPVSEAAARLRGASQILIKGASLVITVDSQLGEGPLGTLEDADVLLEGDRIIKVGVGIEAPGAAVVQAAGQIVMPGFVDTHDHLWQSLIRGCSTDLPLPGWLQTCVFPMFALGLTDADAYAAVRLSTVGLVETGVTTVLDDSHAFGEAFTRGNLRALDESGLRYVFAHCGQEGQFDEIRQLSAQLKGRSPAASLQVCSHPGRAMEDWLRASADLSRELGLPLNVHLAEDQTDLKQAQMDTLREVRAFDGPLVVNHAIHLSDADLDQLAASDVRVTHNPLSNMRLGAGIMRLGDMRQRGIKVGLGLDGGCGDMPDAFANMKAAVGLQRAQARSVTVSPTVAEVLRMATLGGAEVLGLQGEIGSLTPGKRADLILIDPSGPTFAPRTDWPAQIVFNGRPSDVSYVFVGGVALKVEGQVSGVDSAALVRQVEALAASLATRREALGEGIRWGMSLVE